MDLPRETDGQRRLGCGIGGMRDATGPAPEQVYDPTRFMAHLADRGLHGWRDLAMTEAL